MLTAACYPVSGPEAIVNAKLVLACLQAGWRVDIISENRSGYPIDQEDTWNELSQHVVCCPKLDRGITFRKLLSEAKGMLLLRKPIRGAGWAEKALHVATKLAEKNDYDVVLARTPPAFLAAMHLGRRTGIPWIANWNDPWPRSKAPVPYGLGPQARVPGYITRFIDEVGHEATIHTFCCERLRQYICQYGPQEMRDHSAIIPHIALNRFTVHKHARHTHRKFSLCHAGKIAAPREPDVFFAGLSDFLRTGVNRSEISVVFFGQQPRAMTSLTEAYHISDVVRIEQACRYTEAIHKLAEMDVLVIIEAKCQEGVFLPSKFVDYIQTGCPILAISPARGTVHDVMSKYGGGILADCTRREEVAEALAVLHQHWRHGSLQSKFSSSPLLQLYREDVVMHEYERMCESIINGGQESE
jgi:hypothetical protein